MRRALLCLMFLGACDCSESGLVRVNVRTDYLPDVEFDEVSLSVDDTDFVELVAVDGTQDFVAGVRIAEIPVQGDEAFVRGRLTLDGAVLAQRVVQVRVSSTNAVTLVFTRDCSGVSCPSPSGSSEATQCEDGQCVAPDCSPETPEACEGERCTANADCAAPIGACAEARCVDGACFDVAFSERCDDGEGCLPELGCVRLEPDPEDDGGGGEVDMGPPPDCTADADCDDGAFCNGAERCAAGSCVGGSAPDCADTIDCTADGCDEAGDTCTNAPDDGRCTDSAGGTCEAAGCQYPTCTPMNCVAGPCQTATCMGDTCQRTDTCSGGEMCCGGSCVPAGCDDGNPCTADSCGPGGCVNAPEPSGVTCGASSCGAWGPCIGISCSSGTQRRSCYDLECDGAGACAMANPVLEPRGCAKEDGDACGLCNECGGGSTNRCPGTCVGGCCSDVL
ncbi:MAG: hypothetical protein JJ863_24315 [Deltaproteobacteria bacterium]|nr:hypothetical protein [Deltaproteobacteria bacterium]